MTPIKKWALVVTIDAWLWYVIFLVYRALNRR